MNYKELQNKASDLYPAVLMESFIKHAQRRKIRFWLLIAIVITLFIIVIAFAMSAIDSQIGVNSLLTVLSYNIRGLFLLLLTAWLALFFMDAMYFSFFFKKDAPMDFQVALIMQATKEDDVTKGFLHSLFGKQVMMRLGIPPREVQVFLDNRKEFVTKDDYVVIEQDEDPYITIGEYARSIIHFDSGFSTFLNDNAIDGDMFRDTIRWVAQNHTRRQSKEAWWQKDQLERIPSVGRDWAYGQVYHLEKFGHPLEDEPMYEALRGKSRFYEENITVIEEALAKAGGNVIVTAEQSVQAITVIHAFAHYIKNGKSKFHLEQKRLYVLDGERVIESMREKVDVEKQLRRIFAQAAVSGNVIIVLPNMDVFAESAAALDVEIYSLLESILTSSSLQLITTATTNNYHQTLEPHHDLLRHFELVKLPEIQSDALTGVLQTEAQILEKKVPVLFSIQAIMEVASAAERFFGTEDIQHRSASLLFDVARHARKQGKVIVTRQHVDEIVEKKTGIAVGDISKDEKEKLTNLEEILHKRIIGQDAAITAISGAMRRARAGLTNPKRPMGSFLFLGPTGVGKTETTKALAATFFESEKNIIRIDMSEYSSEEGLEKLIGSYKKNIPGLLASKLRERQYGVLLLDEFEKASKQVHDLFLQILDEGYFTDGKGEKVLARNLIIIATSNAGSDLIYKGTIAIEKGEAGFDSKKIVDEIIEQGIFRPELVNRFDGAIVFHALNQDHLQRVAVLMIASLEKRLMNKKLKINQTPELLAYLADKGSDTKFGARSMNRAIQDEVERIIADGIIAGDVLAGQTVTLVPSVDNTSLTLKTNK
jgi:ATP-dependent Clp protease ATP-binding subunit ClpA